MTKKERMVMSYLCNKCQQKRTYLISPQEITQALSKKFVLSVEEIDEIMVTLSNENYIDFVVSDSKRDIIIVSTLRKVGSPTTPTHEKIGELLDFWCFEACFLPLSALFLA